mmetsp:Transcript_76640/g.228429  ORF Transcript_76640/g.228429 Transcript_76640/m.228429 type:complete len:291 (+) Transcript_76640:471-1343(+)
MHRPDGGTEQGDPRGPRPLASEGRVPTAPFAAAAGAAAASAPGEAVEQPAATPRSHRLARDSSGSDAAQAPAARSSSREPLADHASLPGAARRRWRGARGDARRRLPAGPPAQVLRGQPPGGGPRHGRGGTDDPRERHGVDDGADPVPEGRRVGRPRRPRCHELRQGIGRGDLRVREDKGLRAWRGRTGSCGRPQGPGHGRLSRGGGRNARRRRRCHRPRLRRPPWSCRGHRPCHIHLWSFDTCGRRHRRRHRPLPRVDRRRHRRLLRRRRRRLPLVWQAGSLPGGGGRA